MKRSVGVTVSAILALVVSSSVALLGLLMLAVVIAAASRPMEQPENFPFPPSVFKAFMMVVPLMYLLPAAWGITTGIGLLRLRNWARISIIVFASLLTIYGVFGGLMGVLFTLVRLPQGPETDPGIMMGIRIVMVSMALVQLSIGIWWLIFFNRAKVRDQFRRTHALEMRPTPVLPTMGTLPPPPIMAQTAPIANFQPPAAPARPTSITIIGWYLLIVSFYVPLNLALHTPAMFFNKLLTGWPAALYYVAVGAAHLCIGIGLLKLWRAARIFGIAYLLLFSVNSAVFCLAPGARERIKTMMALQYSVFPGIKEWQDTLFAQFDMTPLIIASMLFGLLIFGVILYFLIINKAAFERKAL
jgi:hypothetical protein